ncbi:MAG: GAF domain-containing sensor histidine kinase [Anaerolineaceae bacterium]|jgi:signal transduction histidine kinase
MEPVKNASGPVKARAIISSDLPFLADWYVISLRWTCLLGFQVVTALNGIHVTGIGIVLVAAAVINLVMSLLAILNKRLYNHRLIAIAIDLATCGAMYSLTGGLAGPLNWAGLLPLFTASIYYELSGGLLAAVLVSFMMIGVIFLTDGGLAGLTQIGILVGFNLASGLILGLSSKPLMRRLRRNYTNTLLKRQESERKVRLQEHERMQAVYRMIETLSATLNYELVLNTSLDLSLTALSGSTDPGLITDPLGLSTGHIQQAGSSSNAYNQKMVCAVLLFSGHDLVVGSSRLLSPPDLRQTFQAEQGVLYDAISTAEPRLITNPADDPELKSLLCVRTCNVALVLPLRRGLDAFGAMLFAHPDPVFFNPDRIETLEMISHQAVISIQNALLYQEMEREKLEVIEIQEEARKKLARDLHDGPTQSLAAIAMRADIVRRIVISDPQEAIAEVIKIEDLARRTTQEIRHMLFTLRPLILETEGLVPALHSMADKMRDTYQQNITVDVDAAIVQQLEVNKQTVIFSLVEEAINNARKHAQASQIYVSLKCGRDAGIARLEICDNGLGFDVKAINKTYEKSGSLGMVNLRERSQLISGLLNIDSVPGKGTRVQVFIPLNEEASDRLQRGIAE